MSVFRWGVLFFVLIYAVLSKAQDKLEFDLQRNQFSLGFVAGINKARFQSNGQDEKIQDPHGFNYAVRFAYRNRIQEKFYLEGGLIIGIQNEKIIPPNEEFNNELKGFFRGGIFPNARIDFSGAYELWTNSRVGISLFGGVGITRFADFSLVSEFITESTNFSVTYAIKNTLIPFANLGTEFTMKNKRNDEFGIRVFYNQGFSSFYDGTYTLWKNYQYSEGTVSSLLSGFNLGLNYTFTRSLKNIKLNDFMSNEEMNRKSAKKRLKFEKRAIEPKSQFVYSSIGIGIIRNEFITEVANVSPRKSRTLSFSVGYERGWKKKIFFEFEYNYLNFNHGFRIQYTPDSFGEWGGDAFSSHFLNAGIQYKLQNPVTNFQFLNFHAGVGLGYQFNPKGDQPYEGVGFSVDNFSFNYNSISTIRGNAMPMLYTGVSKDFRVTEKFILNLSYRYQFGFKNVHVTDYYFTTSESSGIQSANSKINGTAFFLKFGCKIRII